MLIAVIANG